MPLRRLVLVVLLDVSVGFTLGLPWLRLWLKLDRLRSRDPEVRDRGARFAAARLEAGQWLWRRNLDDLVDAGVGEPESAVAGQAIRRAIRGNGAYARDLRCRVFAALRGNDPTRCISAMRLLNQRAFMDPDDRRRLLLNPDMGVRRKALRMFLGGHDHAFALLAESLRADDDWVRHLALFKLWRFGRPDAVFHFSRPIMEAMLAENATPDFRYLALVALSHTYALTDLPPFEGVLRRGEDRSLGDRCRGVAAWIEKHHDEVDWDDERHAFVLPTSGRTGDRAP